MKTYLLARWAFSAAATLAVFSRTLAQSVTTAPGETITLSEFSVADSKDNSYLASESVTGSRVATSIRDLPYDVNVVTGDFLKDFDAFTIPEMLAYTSGFSGRQQEGAAVLRGFFTGNQLRNGLRRAGLTDPSSIDRIEVIKGAAAAVYGQTTPGGTINVISKKPQARPAYEASVSAGNFDFFRGTFAATGPVAATALGSFYYRVSGSDTERDYEQMFRRSQLYTVTPSLTWQLNKDTSLFLEYDFVTYNTRPGTGIPYRTQPTTVSVINARTGLPANVTYTRVLGYAYDLDQFSLEGPSEFLRRDIHMGSAVLEHRVNEVFSTRFAGSAYNRHYYKSSMTNGNYDPVTRTIASRQPAFDEIYEWNRSAQADLLARYATDFILPMTHATLATVDYSFVGDNRPSFRWLATDLNSLPADVRNLNVDRPNYLIPGFTTDTYKTKSSWTGSGTEVKGAFLRQASSLFNEKLRLLAAVRYDKLEARTKNKLTTVVSTTTPSATSPQFGISYTVTPQVTIYASHAKSFIAQTAVTNAGQILPNETGVTDEIGAKLSFFNQRLNLTTAYYYIKRDNVAITTVLNTQPLRDAAGNPIIDSSTGQPILQNITDQAAGGVDAAHGIDFDINWAITDQLIILGNVTYLKARVVDAGTDLDRRGRFPREAPANSSGLAARYAFNDGGLKGLSFNAGVRYRGKVYPNNRSGGLDLNSDGLVETNNGQREVRIPSYTLLNLGASYDFKASPRRLDHSVQVTVKNALDKRWYDEDAYLGDGFAFVATYGVRF